MGIIPFRIEISNMFDARNWILSAVYYRIIVYEYIGAATMQPMTSIERFTNFLRRKPMDRIPVYEHFWSDKL